MTQEKKDLLLKDLCARLPYGVKVNCNDKVYNFAGIHSLNICVLSDDNEDNAFTTAGIKYIKPYLFPISNMTEEMLEELNANGFFKYRDTIANVSHLESKNGISEEIYTYIDIECISFLIKYFYSHHIDFLGLIEMGLALDATGLNVY